MMSDVWKLGMFWHAFKQAEKTHGRDLVLSMQPPNSPAASYARTTKDDE